MNGPIQPRRRVHAALLTILLLSVPGALSLRVNAQAEAGSENATATDASSEVLAVVTRLFDGMRLKDESLLRSLFTDDARLGSNGIDAFVEQVTAGSAHLDEITYDETVLIDGNLAMAWTPYQLFVDGEFHHCGVDVFIMRRENGVWKIHQIDDTRRVDGCSEIPDK